MNITTEGFDWGDCVRILGSDVVGFVIGHVCHMRREPSYFVEYLDGNGSPQEREWSESQLTLMDGGRTEAGEYPDEEHDDDPAEENKVVPFRRKA